MDKLTTDQVNDAIDDFIEELERICGSGEYFIEAINIAIEKLDDVSTELHFNQLEDDGEDNE